MGSKGTRIDCGTPNWSVIPGSGPVAQVAHPTSLKWSPRVAADTLIAAARKVPDDVRLLVTGGGFVSLNYPETPLSTADLRHPEFLARLHSWTLAELSEVFRAIGHSPERDLVIGVDVSVKDRKCGQFGLWVGRDGSTLVPKRFPAADEANYLAGVDMLRPGPYPQVLETQLGPTLLLVCHDAQAYNRRNRASVFQATHRTARANAISELDEARTTPGLAWALNVVHWIERKADTRTFHVSYKQLREDFTGAVKVAGGFGYRRISVASVPGLLDLMVAPQGMILSKVIIRR